MKLVKKFFNIVLEQKPRRCRSRCWFTSRVYGIPAEEWKGSSIKYVSTFFAIFDMICPIVILFYEYSRILKNKISRTEAETMPLPLLIHVQGIWHSRWRMKRGRPYVSTFFAIFDIPLPIVGTFFLYLLIIILFRFLTPLPASADVLYGRPQRKIFRYSTIEVRTWFKAKHCTV